MYFLLKLYYLIIAKVNTMSLEHIHNSLISQSSLSTCPHMLLPASHPFLKNSKIKQNLLPSLHPISADPVFTGAGSQLLKHGKHITAHHLFSQNWPSTFNSSLARCELF